jgi:hypothetical protein
MWKTQVSLGKPSTTRGFPWISHMSKVDFPTSKEQRDEQTLWPKAGVSVSLRRLLGGESQRPFGVRSCRGAIRDLRMAVVGSMPLTGCNIIYVYLYTYIYTHINHIYI